MLILREEALKEYSSPYTHQGEKMGQQINKEILRICSQIKKRGQDVKAFKDLHIGIIQMLLYSTKDLCAVLTSADDSDETLKAFPFVDLNVDYDRMIDFLGDFGLKYEKLSAEMMKIRY